MDYRLWTDDSDNNDDISPQHRVGATASDIKSLSAADYRLWTDDFEMEMKMRNKQKQETNSPAQNLEPCTLHLLPQNFALSTRNSELGTILLAPAAAIIIAAAAAAAAAKAEANRR